MITLYAYNEQRAGAYYTTAASYYAAAHHPIDSSAGIWAARFDFDAMLYGYDYSSTKHLHELWLALGQPSVPVPPPAPIYDMAVTPVNVATADPVRVTFYVTWWLLSLFANTPENNTYWFNTVMAVYEPTHTPGWTADTYWSDKMSAGYPNEILWVPQ